MPPDRHRCAPFWMAALLEGGVGLLAGLLAWGFSIPLAARMAFGFREIGWGLAATVPMLLGFWWLLAIRNREWNRLWRYLRRMVRILFPTGSVVQMAVISILAGLGEEALFRGVLQPGIGDWTAPWIGIVAASLLFGFAHSISRLYFVLATIIGLYLGCLAHVMESVMIPAIAHAAYDFIVLYHIVRIDRKSIGHEMKTARFDDSNRTVA